MADDKMNPYGSFTQFSSDEEEEWICPIERATEDELGNHPYAISTMPGADGHPHHFSTKSLYEWVDANHTNPMTREYVPLVERKKLARRLLLTREFPSLDKREPIDYASLFTDPTADMSVLHRRVEPSELPCFHSFDGIEPSGRRNAANVLLTPDTISVGSWLIRKGSIKSVEKAAVTNTPANSYVFTIKTKDGFKFIPFIHFFGYGFRICLDFEKGADLKKRIFSLDDASNWYFTFGDLVNKGLVELDFSNAVLSV